MPSFPPILLILFLSGITLAAPAELILMDDRAGAAVVRQSPGALWKVGDSVCFAQGQVLRCGTVIRANRKRVLLRLKRDKRNLSGDVPIAVTPIHLNESSRSPASRSRALAAPETGQGPRTIGLTNTNDEARPKEWNLAGGIGFGPNFLFSLLSLQAHLVRRVALSVGGLFSIASSGGASVKAVGALATLNYYLTRDTFRGLVAESGAIYYHITASDGAYHDEASSLGPVLLLGWRAKTNHGFNLCFSGGGQYLMHTGPSSGFEFTGIKPLLRVDAGVNF